MVKNQKSKREEIDVLEEMNKKLEAIFTLLVLKENNRENQVKTLKSAGLTKNQIIDIIGISETTKRTRKHRQTSKSTKKQKGFLSKIVSRE